MGVEVTVALIEQVSLSDLVIIAFFVGVVLDRVADVRGWSRSSKALRTENSDLIRRNGELQQDVLRHEDEILRLKTQVADLERTNQAAVLTEIKLHETNAAVRFERMFEVQSEIRDNLLKAA